MEIYMSNCNICSLQFKKYMSKSMYGSRFKLSRCNVIFDKYKCGCSFRYSYFEKGCRIKCTRQPRKVLWVVFEFTIFQGNLKEWQERPWTCVCEC